MGGTRWGSVEENMRDGVKEEAEVDLQQEWTGCVVAGSCVFRLIAITAVIML